MSNTIRLNDGTEFPARFCSAREVLTMDIQSGKSFFAIAEFFSDIAKTCVIEFLYGDYCDRFEGFTDLRMINGSTDGEYLISLRKGEDNGDTVS